MAALTRWPRRAAAAVLLLALPVFAAPPKKPAAKPAPAAPSAPAPAPAPAPPPAPLPTDPVELVKLADAAFLKAEFERARDAANRAVQLLEQPAADGMPPADAKRLRVHALDLLAQSRYNLGERDASTTMDWLIEADPGYRVDAAVAGNKYVELFEQHRRKMVGYIVPACTPVSCESVAVDGRPATPDGDGAIAVLAGTRNVVLSRRNYREVTLPPLEVPAGERVPAKAELEPLARDILVATSPAQAKITIDGKDVGVTEPGPDPDGPSRPLRIPGLAPGPRAIVAEAPCSRRTEQAVEVVLDAANPEPQDAGTIELQKTHSVLQVKWSNPAGTVTVDSRPVTAGPVDVCPGRHEVALSIAGRRVWFDTVETHDEETVTITPQPRPTVAVVRSGATPAPEGFPGKSWNEVALAAGPAEGLTAKLVAQLPVVVPMFPAVQRLALAGLAAEARAAAPEADLVALVLPGRDPIRVSQVLVLVDTRREIVEFTAWPREDAKAGALLADAFSRPARTLVGYTGLDLADRTGRPPVIASVAPDGPAATAGLAAGQVVVAWNGKPVTTASALPPEQDLDATPVTVRIADAKGERDVTLTPATALNTPLPTLLRQQPGVLLLPTIARADLVRVAGEPADRSAAGVLVGLALAALGIESEAAAVLDRAAIDEALDPQGDARGTEWFVLEGLLRRLGRVDYANEVRARWKLLERARLGGRSGPPLRAGLDASLD